VGRVLEIGPGIGALLYELASSGWSCTGVEGSTQALALARQALLPYSHVQLLDSLPAHEQYDYLLAFEVLEHIEDDRAALTEWLQLLKPGGKVLLSVPSDPGKWGASDVLAGHFRRYDRPELTALLIARGYQIENVFCYGWPLSNVLYWIRTAVDYYRLRRERGLGGADLKRQRTGRSGIERRAECRLYPLYGNYVGALAMAACLKLQNWTLARDWGTGYLVIARRAQAIC
jgi:SAM-dependent methyltransferase